MDSGGLSDDVLGIRGFMRSHSPRAESSVPNVPPAWWYLDALNEGFQDWVYVERLRKSGKKVGKSRGSLHRSPSSSSSSSSSDSRIEESFVKIEIDDAFPGKYHDVKLKITDPYSYDGRLIEGAAESSSDDDKDLTINEHTLFCAEFQAMSSQLESATAMINTSNISSNLFDSKAYDVSCSSSESQQRGDFDIEIAPRIKIAYGHFEAAPSRLFDTNFPSNHSGATSIGTARSLGNPLATYTSNDNNEAQELVTQPMINEEDVKTGKAMNLYRACTMSDRRIRRSMILRKCSDTAFRENMNRWRREVTGFRHDLECLKQFNQIIGDIKVYFAANFNELCVFLFLDIRACDPRSSFLLRQLLDIIRQRNPHSLQRKIYCFHGDQPCSLGYMKYLASVFGRLLENSKIEEIFSLRDASDLSQIFIEDNKGTLKTLCLVRNGNTATVPVIIFEKADLLSDLTRYCSPEVSYEYGINDLIFYIFKSGPEELLLFQWGVSDFLRSMNLNLFLGMPKNMLMTKKFSLKPKEKKVAVKRLQRSSTSRNAENFMRPSILLLNGDPNRTLAHQYYSWVLVTSKKLTLKECCYNILLNVLPSIGKEHQMVTNLQLCCSPGMPTDASRALQRLIVLELAHFFARKFEGHSVKAFLCWPNMFSTLFWKLESDFMGIIKAEIARNSVHPWLSTDLNWKRNPPYLKSKFRNEMEKNESYSVKPLERRALHRKCADKHDFASLKWNRKCFIPYASSGTATSRDPRSMGILLLLKPFKSSYLASYSLQQLKHFGISFKIFYRKQTSAFEDYNAACSNYSIISIEKNQKHLQRMSFPLLKLGSLQGRHFGLGLYTMLIDPQRQKSQLVSETFCGSLCNACEDPKYELTTDLKFLQDEVSHVIADIFRGCALTVILPKGILGNTIGLFDFSASTERWSLIFPKVHFPNFSKKLSISNEVQAASASVPSLLGLDWASKSSLNAQSFINPWEIDINWPNKAFSRSFPQSCNADSMKEILKPLTAIDSASIGEIFLTPESRVSSQNVVFSHKDNTTLDNHLNILQIPDYLPWWTVIVGCAEFYKLSRNLMERLGIDKYPPVLDRQSLFTQYLHTFKGISSTHLEQFVYKYMSLMSAAAALAANRKNSTFQPSISSDNALSFRNDYSAEIITARLCLSYILDPLICIQLFVPLLQFYGQKQEKVLDAPFVSERQNIKIPNSIYFRCSSPQGSVLGPNAGYIPARELRISYDAALTPSLENHLLQNTKGGARVLICGHDHCELGNECQTCSPKKGENWHVFNPWFISGTISRAFSASTLEVAPSCVVTARIAQPKEELKEEDDFLGSHIVKPGLELQLTHLRHQYILENDNVTSSLGAPRSHPTDQQNIFEARSKLAYKSIWMNSSKFGVLNKICAQALFSGRDGVTAMLCTDKIPWTLHNCLHNTSFCVKISSNLVFYSKDVLLFSPLSCTSPMFLKLHESSLMTYPILKKDALELNRSGTFSGGKDTEVLLDRIFGNFEFPPTFFAKLLFQRHGPSVLSEPFSCHCDFMFSRNLLAQAARSNSERLWSMALKSRKFDNVMSWNAKARMAKTA